jgi:predicted transcriptional regulator
VDNSVKQELHQLIDDCDNELLLTEAKELLLSSTVQDWWEELSEEDKNSVFESEADYKKGEYVSHEELMKQFAKWKKK